MATETVENMAVVDEEMVPGMVESEYNELADATYAHAPRRAQSSALMVQPAPALSSQTFHAQAMPKTRFDISSENSSTSPLMHALIDLQTFSGAFIWQPQLLDKLGGANKLQPAKERIGGTKINVRNGC